MLYTVFQMGDRLVSTLRERRTDAGFTQEALANAVGVSRQTINSIETERYVPSTVLALRLAEVLRMPVERLFHLPHRELKRRRLAS